MALLDHNGESEFPLPKDQVFEAICRAIPTIKGMKIDYADKLQGRVMVKAGVTLWSWGEDIPIQLSSLPDNKTKVQITSTPKTGIMFGGAFDMGKNRRNIENILTTTSRILSSQQNQTTSVEGFQQSNIKQTNNYSSNRNQTNMQQNYKKEKPWYKKTWVIVVGVIIALGIIGNLGSKKDGTSTSTSTSSSTNSTQQQQTKNALTEAEEKAKVEKSEIKEKLKTKAKRDWPNDYTTQEFWVNEQLDAYDYMLTIENNSIKKQAQRDWPLDFSTQKFWYNEQIEAKERMK